MDPRLLPGLSRLLQRPLRDQFSERRDGRTGFFLYEDFGLPQRLCLFAAHAEKLIHAPIRARRWSGFFKDYVSAGDPAQLPGMCARPVPLFIEAGFDCLQPMEAKAGCAWGFARVYGNKLAYNGQRSTWCRWAPMTSRR